MTGAPESETDAALGPADESQNWTSSHEVSRQLESLTHPVLKRRGYELAEKIHTTAVESLCLETHRVADQLTGYLENYWSTLHSQLEYLRFRVPGDARLRSKRSEVYRVLRDVSRWPRMLAERCDAELRRRKPSRVVSLWLDELESVFAGLPTLTVPTEGAIFEPAAGDGWVLAMRKAWALRSLGLGAVSSRVVPLGRLARHDFGEPLLDLCLDWNNRQGALTVEFWRKLFHVSVECHEFLEHLDTMITEGRPFDWDDVIGQLRQGFDAVRSDTERFVRDIERRVLGSLGSMTVRFLSAVQRVDTFLLPRRKYDSEPSEALVTETLNRVATHADAWSRLASGTMSTVCVQLDAGAFVGAVWYAFLRDSGELDALFEERLCKPARRILDEGRQLSSQLAELDPEEPINSVMQLTADGREFVLHRLVQDEGLLQVSTETTRALFTDRMNELRRSVGRASQKVASGFSVVLTREAPLQEGNRPPNPPAHELPMRSMADTMVMSRVSGNVEQTSRVITSTLDRAEELLRDILRAVDFSFEAATEEMPDADGDRVRAQELARQIAANGLGRVVDKAALLETVAAQRQRETIDTLEDALDASVIEFIKRIRTLTPDPRTAAADVTESDSAPGLDLTDRRARRDAPARTSRAAALRDDLTMVGLTDQLRAASFSRFTRGPLTEAYRRLFTSDDRDDAIFDVGLNRDLGGFQDAMSSWERGDVESIALVGLRGVGKSSIFKQLQTRLGSDYPSVKVRVGQRICDESGLAALLSQGLNLPAGDSLAELEARVCARQDRLVVYVEGGERLFLRHPAGLDGIRALMSFIRATDERILWIVSFEQAAFDFLQRVLALSESFTTVVPARNLTRADLEQFILLRHDISGVALSYRDIGGNRTDSAAATAYFDQLHRVTDGYPPLAVYLWLSSLSPSADGRDLVVSLAQPLPDALLSPLDGLRCAALASILLHGGLTLDEFAQVLRVPRGDAAALLGQLRHAHLVEGQATSQRGFTVNRVAYQHLYKELAQRNLL